MKNDNDHVIDKLRLEIQNLNF